jgi:hypothetical protein
MKAVPSYGKILTIGSAFTENALVGPVVIQEKVDGSQFAFGMNEYGELLMRSKGAPLFEDQYADMFMEAVQFAVTLKGKLKGKSDMWFYCEYLQKPKHNTLKYENTPKNHLVLFDIVHKGAYQSRVVLEEMAVLLDIDVIPELWKGDLADYLLNKYGDEKGNSTPGDFLKGLAETTPSYLGGETVEGLVIKNYTQTIMLGGNLFPLFTKHVREAFKERHSVDWKIRQPKDSLQTWMEGFKSEARWQKAILHSREKGTLTQSPKDIGPLLKEIQQDIKDEETENIKNYLYKCFIDDICRKAVFRFPEWYKELLMSNLKVGEVSKGTKGGANDSDLVSDSNPS